MEIFTFLRWKLSRRSGIDERLRRRLKDITKSIDKIPNHGIQQVNKGYSWSTGRYGLKNTLVEVES